MNVKMPSYLKGMEEPYKQNPRKANLDWFKQAKYGMFVHYGLYSQVGNHEWLQLRQQIRVDEYAKLADDFTAGNFDADKLVSFAKECGMKYINITTRHHDCFCLWDTKYTDFKSTNTSCGRDLIKELADACEKHEMALFLYYSHGRDWKHPHAPNNDEWGGKARPEYNPPEETYKYGDEHDLNIYLKFMEDQITELLEMFPQAAGIWLDGIGVPFTGDYTKFKTAELYEMIRAKHPHALISYKQGLLGTEDFFAPEHGMPSGKLKPGSPQYKHAEAVAAEQGITFEEVEAKIAANHVGKIASRPDTMVEVCTTMIQNPVSWGYTKDAYHQNEEEVWENIRKARSMGYNLLLNSGPMGDGSTDPHDEKVLRAIGKRLKEEGFPGEL